MPDPVIEVVTFEPVSFPALDYHVAAGRMTWSAATSYASALGAGWRLPTKEELQAFSPQLKTAGHVGDFWSSSTVPSSAVYVYVVYLALGANYYFNLKDTTCGVICVR